VRLGTLELTLVLTVMILTSATAFLSYDSFQVFALSGVPVDGDGVPLEDHGDTWEGADVLLSESDIIEFSSSNDAFGGTGNTAGHLLFANDGVAGTTKTLVWEIDDPIKLTSFHLIAALDADPRDIRYRGFTEFRLYGCNGTSCDGVNAGDLLHTETITTETVQTNLVGVKYNNVNDSPAAAGLEHYLGINRDVTTSTTYSKFKAEFDQAAGTDYPTPPAGLLTALGPRIVELDGYSDHSINLQSPSEGDVLGIGDIIIQFILGVVLGTSYTSTVSVVENFGDSTQVFSSSTTFTPSSSTLISSSFSDITTEQDGEHTVTVLLQSSTTTIQSSVNVIVDTTPPSSFLISFPNQLGFVGTATPIILGTVFDATTTTVAVSFDGGSLLPADDVVIGSNWSLTTLTPLTQGAHEIQATATDSAGNIAISSLRAFTIDSIFPVVTISSPLNSAIIAIATPTILGTVIDATPTTVGVSFNEPHDSFITATVTGSNWSLTSSGLADGSYDLVARATDSAGNTVDSATTSITVDTTPPTVSITTPADGVFIASSSLTFTGSESDDTTNVESVQVSIDSGPFLDAVITNSWEFAIGGLADGARTAIARATDTAGNVGEAVRNFNIDTTPPVTTVTGATDGNMAPVVSGVNVFTSSNTLSVALASIT